VFGQIQERLYHIETRNKVPTNTGWNVRVCFIEGLQNISGQIQQFSASKQNKNFIQTQSENEWFFLVELKDYEGQSNENLKSAIKILNTARLSCALTTTILMD